MSLFEKTKQKIFRRSINLIEWIAHTPKTVIWHFAPYHAYFKSGVRLKVRDEQIAVLISEGRLADMYQPGEYELTTSNMPILATMNGWKRNFNSAFKMNVYFVRTKQFADMAWITRDSILIHDAEFGPIHICAFGTYSFSVHHNPIVFIRKMVGTDGQFSTDSIIEQLGKLVITKLTDYLTESNIAAFDLTTNLREISNDFTITMKKDFLEYGIELSDFLIESIALPKVVEAALSKKTRMRSIGNMTTYTEMRFDNSFRNEIKN